MAEGSVWRRGARRTAGLVVGMLTLVLSAACTTTVPGTPAAADRSGPASRTSPAPSTSAEPAPDIIAAPTDPAGRALEAHRLAGATALVSATFPDRADSCSPSGAFVDSLALETAYFPDGTAADILEKYGFVTAWGQCGQTVDQLATGLLTIELSDPAAATAAATELAIAAKQPGDRGTTIENGIPVISRALDDQDLVQVWAPVGRTIAYNFHFAPAGTGFDGATLMINAQIALLGGFTPTPQPDVPNLPPDPVGLAAFALDPPGSVDPITGPFDLESYLRIAIDPVRERDLLTANGFTGMYVKQSTDGTLYYSVALYAFPTSAQTNVVYDGFAELETSSFGGTPFVLPAVPQAPCFFADVGTPDQPYFYQRCYVGFGSYLASVDVAGLAAAEDSTIMNGLLPQQRDLIDG